MKNMPNIWLDNLTNFDATLDVLESCLVTLKDNATEADFYDLSKKKQYSNDVMYMKQLFEKAEKIARGLE